MIFQGGLHQCLSEKIDQGEPACGQRVPFSGLVQAHTPGESRVFAPIAIDGTSETDSLVAKLVNPASNAKIVTASRIEVSFLRVEIETRAEASVIACAR